MQQAAIGVPIQLHPGARNWQVCGRRRPALRPLRTWVGFFWPHHATPATPPPMRQSPFVAPESGDDGAPVVTVKRNPGIRAKALGWIKRYGLPEVAGTLMAYWGYFTAHGATKGNEVASAYAASVCETLGFFSVVIIRQVIADRARAVRRLHNYGWSGAGKTIRNLVMEFGVPEIVDTGFIRPLAMGTAAHFFGAGWGIAVGKIVSDISFFLPAIMLDELEKRMDALHKSDVFGGVSDEDIQFFASMFDRRDLADGEVLCAKGDVATEIYVVKDGVVEVRVKSDGPPLATLGRSTVLGEYGMFTGERRNATVTAKGPVAVLTLDYERFRRFMIAFPEGTIALLKSAVLRQMKMREDI